LPHPVEDVDCGWKVDGVEQKSRRIRREESGLEVNKRQHKWRYRGKKADEWRKRIKDDGKYEKRTARRSASI